MRLRRLTATLGPPLLAATVLAALVLPAMAGPARLRATGSAPVLADSTPAALPTCSPRHESDSVDQAAVAGAAWYRLDPVLNAAGSLDGQRLVVGRVGERADIELALTVESFASGPSRGRVLVGTDNGRRSTVRAVDVGARCVTLLYGGSDLVRRAVFDPSGDGIVEFRLDRSSRADLGVWSRSLDGSAPRRILDPLAPNARIGRVFATELSWSGDRNRLIVTSCGAAFCLARILDRSTGRVTAVDDPHVGQVLGLVGDDVVAYGGCPTLPCGIVALNIRTGKITHLAGLAGLAAVSITGGRAVVVYEDYRTDGRLGVVGLDSATLRTLSLADGLRLVPASDRAQAAIELPAGVIAVAVGARPSSAGDAATFIDIADGRRLPAAEVVR